MCGRFDQSESVGKAGKKFNIPSSEIPVLKARYNTAPTQPVAALVGRPRLGFDMLNWGLIPSWAKDPAIGNRMINARSETLTQKPSFRGPYKNSRCIIPADGYYEWKQEAQGKQPYYIRSENKEDCLYLAGLYAQWVSPDGSEIRSCAIITREADEFMKIIHHRMPVMLRDDEFQKWLDPHFCDTKILNTLFEAVRPSPLKAFRVSTLVNSPRNDVPECRKPLETNETAS